MPYRRGMIRQHGSELGVFHRTLDAVLIFSVLWMCGKSYGVPLGLHYQIVGMGAVLVFLFISEWHALYSSWRGDSIGNEAWSIMSAWLLTCCVILALFFLSKLSIQYSRVVIFA